MEGNSGRDNLQRLPLSGRHVTAYLKRLLGKDEQLLAYDDATFVKEAACYVATNFEAESQRSKQNSELEKLIVLPNGATIRVNDDRFRAPEVLFKPNLGGYEADGLGWLLHDALMSAPIDFRRTLSENICLSGGSVELAGFNERVVKELRFVDPIGCARVKVVKGTQLPLQPWIGGSIIASLSSCRWFTLEEFDEAGPRPLVRRMGF